MIHFQHILYNNIVIKLIIHIIIPKRNFLRSVPCSLSNCPVTSASCWEFGGTEGEDSTDAGCREDWGPWWLCFTAAYMRTGNENVFNYK